MTDNESQAEATKASWVSKFWQSLGYRLALMPDFIQDPEAIDPKYKPDALRMSVITYFGWQDRLRILFSGKVVSAIAIKTDTVIEHSYAKTNVAILWPTFKIGQKK